MLADSSGGSVALGAVIWIVLIAIYWSPTIFGALSHKHNLGVIATWNFFGFFLFFPWIVAWVKVAEKPQQPTVVFAPPGWQSASWHQPPPAAPDARTIQSPGLPWPTQPDKPQGYQ